MKREPGFYWVKLDGEWVVADYALGFWLVTGKESDYQDSDFDAIHETRLLPPDQPGSASNSTSS